MSKQARIAIAGLKRGGAWARTLHPEPDMSIAGICDPQADVLNALGDELGLAAERRYTDYETMLRRAGADIVVLATPTPLHASMSLAGLQAGCHVVCEKPLAMSIDEAIELRRAVARYGKRFMVGEQYRFADGCRNLRRALQEGAIGRVGYIAHEFLRGSRFMSRGAEHWSSAYTEATLHDMSVHHFDMWWYVTGQRPTEIRVDPIDPPWNTSGRPLGYSMRATLARGMHVHYLDCRAMARPQTTWYGNVWIAGEEGALFWDGSGLVMLHRPLPAHDHRQQHLAIGPVSYVNREAGTSATIVMVRELVAALREGRPHPCDIDDNWVSFATAMAAVESAETGQVATVATE
jgi:predicted dehydrogenase